MEISGWQLINHQSTRIRRSSPALARNSAKTGVAATSPSSSPATTNNPLFSQNNPTVTDASLEVSLISSDRGLLPRAPFSITSDILPCDFKSESKIKFITNFENFNEELPTQRLFAHSMYTKENCSMA
jgi:hypothetical protein